MGSVFYGKEHAIEDLQADFHEQLITSMHQAASGWCYG
jgi:hypothetical protein